LSIAAPGVAATGAADRVVIFRRAPGTGKTLPMPRLPARDDDSAATARDAARTDIAAGS